MGKSGDELLSPERRVTKTCWVSAAAVASVAEVEEAFEDEREVRILKVWRLTVSTI